MAPHTPASKASGRREDGARLRRPKEAGSRRSSDGGSNSSEPRPRASTLGGKRGGVPRNTSALRGPHRVGRGTVRRRGRGRSCQSDAATRRSRHSGFAVALRAGALSPASPPEPQPRRTPTFSCCFDTRLRTTCVARTAMPKARAPACCRSSVVEHSLGKGEVESSILSGSTSFPLQIKALKRKSALDLSLFHDEQRGVKRGVFEREAWKIRGVLSRSVPPLGRESRHAHGRLAQALALHNRAATMKTVGRLLGHRARGRATA